MANKKYKLRYLPLFEQDLVQTVSYITNVLKNPDAAEKLANDVGTAILERLNNPMAFEPYPSVKKTSEDIVVSDSKELEVSFYDYKNESYTFQYNQYEGKIRLINTRKSIAPSHNITVIIWNEDQLEEQIKYAIEYLI